MKRIKEDERHGKRKGKGMKEYPAAEGWVTYVPEFDDNRESDDPITVEIKPMTVRESMRKSGNVTAKNTSGGIRTNAVDIRQETFCGHVRNVRNLRVGGKDIATAEDLLGTGLGALVGEIEDAITNVSRLSEGDVKNFGSRSGGSGAEAGTAGTATTNGSGYGTAAEHTG